MTHRALMSGALAVLVGGGSWLLWLRGGSGDVVATSTGVCARSRAASSESSAIPVAPGKPFCQASLAMSIACSSSHSLA